MRMVNLFTFLKLKPKKENKMKQNVVDKNMMKLAYQYAQLPDCHSIDSFKNQGHRIKMS